MCGKLPPQAYLVLRKLTAQQPAEAADGSPVHDPWLKQRLSGRTAVTAIGRRKLGISPTKLKRVLHPDFADSSALAGALSGQDAAVWLLR
jgi:hypothetical protein